MLKTCTALTALLVLLIASHATAQIPSSPAVGLSAQTDTGTRPYIAYDGTQENINLTNGNLNLKLPLLHLPGRNGFDLDLRLEYDSKIWKLGVSYIAELNAIQAGWVEDKRWPYIAMGWHLNVPMVNFTSQLLDDGYSVYGCVGTTTIILADGSRHNFSNNPLCKLIYNAPETQIDVMDADDGSGAVLTLLYSEENGNPILSGSTLALSNGTKVYFNNNFFQDGYLSGLSAIASGMEDANGNLITYNSTYSTATGPRVQSIVDTVGRTVSFGYNDTGLRTITYIDHYDGAPVNNTITLNYGQVELNWFFYTPYTHTGEPDVYVTSRVGSTYQQSPYFVAPSPYMLTAVDINGHNFSFQYERPAGEPPAPCGPFADCNFGELRRITYPTGGFTKYKYQRLVHTAQQFPLMESLPTVKADFREIYTKEACPADVDCAITEYTPSLSQSLTSNSGMTVHFPDGHTEAHGFAQETIPGEVWEQYHNLDARETGLSVYAPGGALLKRVLTQYTEAVQPLGSPECPAVASTTPKIWSRPLSIDTILEDGQTKKKEVFCYKKFNVMYVPYVYPPGVYIQPTPTTKARFIDNVAQLTESDWGPGGVEGPTLRRTVNEWVTDAAYITARLLHLKSSSTVYDGSIAVQQTTYSYDAGMPSPSGATVQHEALSGPRGNLTSYRQCLHPGSCSSPDDLVTSYAYDDAGNIVAITDPGSNDTFFGYADNWASTCNLTGTTAAYLTSIADPVGLVTTATYNRCRGTLASVTDPNLVTTSYGYDHYARRTNVTFPPEEAGQGQVNVSFTEPASPNPDNPFKFATSTDINSTTPELVNSVVLDGFGRVCRTVLTSDPDSAGLTVVDTTYDGMGRKWFVTNPYRLTTGTDRCVAYSEASPPTVPYTKYSYDGLGRLTNVRNPDNTNVSTTYVAACTTVTDEAQKNRKSCMDGLGRLTKVFENPTGLNYETDYQYDARDNLTCVEQHGGVSGTGCSADPSNDATSPWRVRRFTYDALSRLVTAKNPESGTISYYYPQADGTLCAGDASAVCRRTDARSVTTTYSYDADNRLIGKSYSGMSEPAVSYSYDAYVAGSNYGRGRRTAMTDAAGTATWTYDSRGRVSQVGRTTSGTNKTVTYHYNLDSSVAWINYPSGRVLNYAYSGAARPIRVWDSTRDYVPLNTVTYTPSGALQSAKLGTNITLSNTHNSRLQPSTLSAIGPGNYVLMSRTYDFHEGAGDNGNVYGITDDVDPLNRPSRPVGSQTFTYDALNRLATAQSTGTDCTPMGGATKDWGNSYTTGGVAWDAWGNLTNKTVTKCSAESLNETVGVNNRFTGANRYDAAGNMTENGAYAYDAENRLVKLTGDQNPRYLYDGDGQRVAKTPTNTLYWLGSGTDALAESTGATLTAEYVFFGGKRAARIDNPGGNEQPPKYYLSDHLGSATVIANADGLTIERETMYFPYGGERWSDGGDANHYRFTGKERDTETGLDYFGARYYGSSMGRFMTPDPLFMELHRLEDPQSLNLYQSVRNNPIALADSTGLDVNLDCSKVSSQQCTQTVTDLNNRQNAQFQVTRGDNGVLQVTDQGKVDVSKLSKSEAELFKAITDTDNHATLQLSPFSASIMGDQYVGKGFNVLDRADLTQFGKANSALPGEIIAHAAVEAYAGVGEGKGSYGDADSFANQFFGNVAVGTVSGLPRGAAMSTSGHALYNFQRVGTTVDVQKIFITPQPRVTVPRNWERIPGNLVVSTTDKKK